MKLSNLHPLKAAKAVADGKVMRNFAHQFGLVYFGNVQQGDEHQLVRGVTLAVDHKDKHFMVGNYKGYDFTVLQRTVTLGFPGQPAKHCRWIIMQADLQQVVLPHILVAYGHQDRLFFDTVAIKHANFQQIIPSAIENDHEFLHNFRVFSAAEAIDSVSDILHPPLRATIREYFRHFDIEIQGDQVIVYTMATLITPSLLQEMLREVLWLAQQFDSLPLPAFRQSSIAHIPPKE